MSQLYQQLLKLTPEQRILFEKKLAEKGINPPRAASIPKRTTEQNLPLSFAQQRLWFVQQLDTNNTAYNVASVLGLRGPLDIVALEKSLNTLVERHETLRTRFELVTTEDGDSQPIQIVDPPEARELPMIDVRSATDPQAAADEHIQTCIATPFDLATGILRTALIQLADNHHLLVLATHHIVSDRWSVMVFLREMTILYRAFSQGQSSPLPPLSIQYADWAIWQRQQLQGEKLSLQTDYWTRQLGGELPVLDLPRDRAYGAVASYRGAQVPIEIAPPLANQLRSLASQHKVTLFTLLLTAFKTLLHRYTASDDIVVGSDVANRDRTETEGLIGLLVNTLVFRSDLSNNPSFSDLLLQVRDTVLSGFAHQDLPFEKLVEVINPDRHLSQMMPLFQVKLDLQQANVKPLQLDGLTIDRYPLAETQAKYELRFNLQETDQGITGQVEYNCDLFDPSTIERMVGHFHILLAGVVANPQQSIAQLPLLSPAEQQTLLVDWNQTQRDYPTHLCIHELFEAQAQKTPDAPVLTDGKRALSYRTLNQNANRLAHHLRELGVGAETRVGVCLPRTASLVVSLLAILKAGGTYVPLDPAYPSERLAFIVEDADISILLAQDISPDVLASGAVKVFDPQQIPETEPTSNLENLASANTLAYVIYTSGSTGRPKGVAIEHRSTVAMLHWARSEFSLEDLSGVLAATSICFDLSVFEIFVPLSWGGRVMLLENALALRDLPESADVRLVNTVPSVLNHLLKVGQLPDSVRTVNLAGEALPATLVQQLQQTPQVQKIYNLYGPSEDTTYSTCAPLHEAAATGHIPIGRPIANTQAYVLDRQQQPVPVGVVGELYLGGSGLARGYLNRPELTANAFTSVILPSASGLTQQRLYRTGDRVRYRADGQLEFLGRFDHQVKIRGFRIEIGEVEAVLRQQPAVQDVVVVAHGETDQQLVAYVVLNVVENDTQEQTRDQAKDPVNELRHALSQQLPAYLVPTLWVTLDALPQLPNGKINRRALPLPQINTVADYVAPRSPLETTLAEIWGDVLHRERVSIHDNFFELGGHSLLAIQIIAQAELALGGKIPLRTLFQAPTIAGFALQVSEQMAQVATRPEDSRLEASTPMDSLPQLVVDVDQRHAPFPLTDIQQAYWLGRAKAFELGNIGTHGYREIEVTGLAVAQIEQVLNRLIERHDMLRAVVNPDGQQQILAEVPHYTIPFTDLRSNTAVHTALAQLRDRLSHQVFSPDQWPLFQIEAAQLSDNRVRFYVSFDVLIGDAWSFQLLGKEMAQLLRGDALQPLAVSFRDYVVAEQAFRHTPAYQQALGYWQDRLPTLPPAPDLPLTQSLSQITAPQFERRSGQLAADQWQQLKQRAYRANLTPSGVVLAAFAEVLSTWSRQPQFTLNLTLFNRQPLHPDVNRLVGDFTASLLLAIDSQGTDSFTTRAQRLQTQLWNDLDHRAVSGVQVLRDLARQQNRSPGALMPVVFTSTLNQPIPASEQAAWQSETVYSVSQTSQVYLDHQVSEIAGALVFNWDEIADLFPAGMLDQMFSAYEQLLHQLAETDVAWQTYPQLAPTEHVAALNQTGAAVQKTVEPLLHSLFWQQVEQQPDAPAVITPERTLTYQALAQQVQLLTQQLRPMVQPNQLVAVSIPKGWQQVVAVLGILTAGAAYVPIDPDLPQERRWQLMADTAARAVVTTAATPDWPNGAIQILLNEQLQTPDDDVSLPQPVQSETDLAYVIYTSGSTGTPKGVMIDHRGAVNTILDINQRFDVGSCDRIFALSSLSFDLSVYDIFGTLAAGATMVMPAASQVKNTAHWRNLLVQHQVTVWNSVPALMGLLLSELSVSGNSSDILDSSLRLAMLSGDWIPLTLPKQFEQQFSDAQLISLGGATEASIWSIAYPIETVDPSWHSIPYGHPLAHQQWYVLDENLHPCPPWVTGQLYIGGVGLAQGYWNRPELTAERFIANPLSQASTALDKDIHGGKLYKTGDLGRYLPDGTLEFLGREDFQVKVNGYRVELGEIESALQQYPAIASAVVDAVGNPSELVAYVVPKLDAAGALNQPLTKLEFKQKRLGIRTVEAEAATVSLPKPQGELHHLRRQSHRQFLSQPIDLERLSNFLAGLSAQDLPGAPLPKYRYASAGSLYPVQTYLHIQPSRVEALAEGWYYYHPTEHCLVKLAEAKEGLLTSLYGPHHQLHAGSAFSLFFVAQMQAIEPIYGNKAKDFCLLEAGYMGQLLMETAPEFNLGLCPIGGFDAPILQQILGLENHHQPLHALVGGAINPAWHQQWMAVSSPPPTASIPETLKVHLSKTLPSYMVPTRYQLLEAIPLTANGKVDRRALPAPTLGTATEYIAPTTPSEQQVVDLWQSLLDVEQVGINDNFFEVGGNSLTAMQLLSQLQQTFSVELTIAQLFGALTPASQAELVAEAQTQTKSPEPITAQQAIQPVQRQAETSDQAPDVSNLSDEDVNSLLAQLLADQEGKS